MSKTVVAVCLVTCAVCFDAVAQQEQVADESVGASLDQRFNEQEQRLTELEAKHQEQLEQTKAQFQAEIDALKAAMDEKVKASEQEDIAQLFEEPDAEESDSELTVHGYFNVNFGKCFAHKDSWRYAYIVNKSSFIVSDLHLYFSAQMAQSFSAMVELGFTFLPHGSEMTPNVYNADGTMKLAEGDRTSTMVMHPLTTQWYFLGGVYIQRVHLDWKPRDWFQLRAGKFLTPYGIWNVDHGPTVVLPTHVPYMQIRAMMPLDQTGLQASGRIFIRGDVYFDYAVTVSNGRSDIINVDIGDFDENKGFGLGLNLTFDKNKLFLKFGAYGYYGSVTDHTKELFLDLETNDFELDVRDTASLDELVISGYALLEVSGLRLQGEYIWKKRYMNKPFPITQQEALFSGYGIGSGLYEASHLGWGVYGLVSYQLPLNRWLEKTRIIPFLYYEKVQFKDTIEAFNQAFVSAGLNLRPSAWIALKFEYLYMIPESKMAGGATHMLFVQAAVSF